MQIYIIKSPERNIDLLLQAIASSENSAIVQDAVWAKGLDSEEIDRVLDEEYDLNYSELQIGWRKIENPEWACALSHHKVYLRAVREFEATDNWICVVEDDVVLLPEFFSRINELSYISFSEPTVIQLFTRGKRFGHRVNSLSREHQTLYKADFPPGQTALYLINRRALQLATSSFVAKGDSDWPIWGRNCDFLFSYPWTAIEYPAGTTLPIYSRTRKEYYRWQIGAILGVNYLDWRKKSLNYSDYFFYMIKPLILRVMFRAKVYRPLLKSDPNSIWVRWQFLSNLILKSQSK